MCRWCRRLSPGCVVADFNQAFSQMMANEGGFRLTDIAGDPGGKTYAGIARRRNPQWTGWAFVDRGETPPTDLVRGFYRVEFWERVAGDQITNQGIAESLFDFAVNSGVKTALKLAQIVAGVAPDGVIGQKTLAALNGLSIDSFRSHYALAKIARYAQIVTRDRSQGKFLLGWINRTLREAI